MRKTCCLRNVNDGYTVKLMNHGMHKTSQKKLKNHLNVFHCPHLINGNFKFLDF